MSCSYSKGTPRFLSEISTLSREVWSKNRTISSTGEKTCLHFMHKWEAGTKTLQREYAHWENFTKRQIYYAPAIKMRSMLRANNLLLSCIMASINAIMWSSQMHAELGHILTRWLGFTDLVHRLAIQELMTHSFTYISKKITAPHPWT